MKTGLETMSEELKSTSNNLKKSSGLAELIKTFSSIRTQADNLACDVKNCEDYYKNFLEFGDSFIRETERILVDNPRYKVAVQAMDCDYPFLVINHEEKISKSFHSIEALIQYIAAP